jgi:hypothetical protein
MFGISVSVYALAAPENIAGGTSDFKKTSGGDSLLEAFRAGSLLNPSLFNTFIRFNWKNR